LVIVSGFLPVPLPMMIPFMGAQSLVIGKMFGEGFQYGKRKISAMPNEEFNKLTMQDMMSNARTEMQASIPIMQEALRDMQPLVETVVHEFFNYIKIIAAMIPEQARELTGGSQILAGSAETKTLNLSQADKDFLVQQSQNKSGDLLGDILEKLGLDRFGQSAGATDVSTTTIPLTTSQIIAKDVSLGAIAIPQGSTLYKGKLITIVRLQQLLNAKTFATQRLLWRNDLKLVKPWKTYQFKQAAGQSQKMQRAGNITTLQKLQNELVYWQSKIEQNPTNEIFKINLKNRWKMYWDTIQNHVNLLERYRF